MRKNHRFILTICLLAILLCSCRAKEAVPAQNGAALSSGEDETSENPDASGTLNSGTSDAAGRSERSSNDSSGNDTAAAGEEFRLGPEDAGEDDPLAPLDVALTEGAAGEDFPELDAQLDRNLAYIGANSAEDPASADLDNEVIDLSGAIVIPSLGLEYPMYWARYDNEYYLEHDADDQESASGCIILDGWNSPDYTDADSIIYGHNMADQSMFGSLKRFIAEPSLVDSDPYVYIYSKDTVCRYQIYAFNTTTDSDPAYQLPELLYQTSEDQRELPAEIESVSLYTPEEAQRRINAWYDAFVKSALTDSIYTASENAASPVPDFARRPRNIMLATCYGAPHGHDRLLVHAVLTAGYYREDMTQ